MEGLEADMEIRPLLTEDDYRAVLREVSALVDQDPEPDSAHGVRLDVLATLVEAYERKHFPIESPDPVEAIVRDPVVPPVGRR